MAGGKGPWSDSNERVRVGWGGDEAVGILIKGHIYVHMFACISAGVCRHPPT